MADVYHVRSREHRNSARARFPLSLDCVLGNGPRLVGYGGALLGLHARSLIGVALRNRFDLNPHLRIEEQEQREA